MKRLTSRFSLVFVVAVAAYFVYFLFTPNGSIPGSQGERAGSLFTKTDQPKQRPPAIQDSRDRDLRPPDWALNRTPPYPPWPNGSKADESDQLDEGTAFYQQGRRR